MFAFLSSINSSIFRGAVNIPLKEMKARIAAEVPDKTDHREAVLQLRASIGAGEGDVDGNGLHAGDQRRWHQSDSAS
ncbi:Uncharacterised protein [Citrobacter freundii]|nr:Uncharacterised protein [Citrobacter freundii]